MATGSPAFRAEEISASEHRGIVRWGDGNAGRVGNANLMRAGGGKIVQGLGYVKD